VENIIGSRARRRILAKTLLAPDREFYLRELARATGLALRSVQVELDSLVQSGLLVERRSGNRRYVRANEGHPLFKPLRELVAKGDGFVGIVREALGTKGVDLALVFGSMAAGTATAESDIDLLIIGELGLREAVRRLAPLYEQLGREIHPIVWTKAELLQRRNAEDHFLMSILYGPHLEVIGGLASA
jgi:predicted nucleotidyltransferase